MPLPRPRSDESKDDFVSRCLGSEPVKKEFGAGSDQAVAVCMRQWEDRHKEGGMETRAVPPHPAWLRAGLATSRPGRVDRDKGVIHGYTVAQLGVFKDRRGKFSQESLRQIAAMMNTTALGTKSRFAHPSLSDDGLGKFLGRSRNARVEGDKVKAELYLSPTSRKTPSGDLGGYVMDLAEADPGAFGSSLVLKPGRYREEGGKLVRLDEQDDGGDDPPLWLPEEIHASDVVDEGDAVHDGFLSVGGELRTALLLGELPDAFVRQGTALLDSVFAGQGRLTVELRVTAWLKRYLSLRYGEPPPPVPTPRLDERRRRLAELDELARVVEAQLPRRP